MVEAHEALQFDLYVVFTQMHMRVHVHICMLFFDCVLTWTLWNVTLVSAITYLFIYLHLYLNVYFYLYLQTLFMCTYVYIYLWICTYTHRQVYIYIYIYIYNPQTGRSLNKKCTCTLTNHQSNQRPGMLQFSCCLAQVALHFEAGAESGAESADLATSKHIQRREHPMGSMGFDGFNGI